MSLALQTEWVKLRTTNTLVALVAAMVGLALLAVLLHAIALPLQTLANVDGQLRVLVEGGETAGVIFGALLGAMSITGEVRHGTIRPTSLAIPQRGRVIAAKSVIAVIAALILGTIIASVAAATGTAAMMARGVSIHLTAGDYVHLIAGVGAGAALWAAIGLGIGAAVRSQVPALAGIFLWLLVVENLLIDSVPNVSRYMPGALARALTGAEANTLLAAPVALTFLAAYAVVITVSGWQAIKQRDIA
ncbi:MAG: ABC transporter permease subunit [Streptomyces sp.]|jgi:hypothetical protein|nr:ABC transporter permease subunit [Streptomyces sp.]